MASRRPFAAFNGVPAWLLASLVLIAPALVRADAQSDYERNWATKEKNARTSAERSRLANEMIKSVNGMISRRSKGGKDTIFELQKDLSSISGSQKDEIIFLCNKTYEIGSKQQDGYAPAARALGIIQSLDAEKRLDSLTKLRKMYDEVYRAGPSKNLGIAKGYAQVNLQLGDEQWDHVQDAQSKGKLPPAEYVSTMKAISANYNKGLEVIRSAMATIRPYAKGKRAYEDFLKSAEEVEKDLLASQKNVAAPLAAALDTERTLRNIASFQTRLANNASDTAAADRLVRLYINEMDDPAAVETVVAKASPAVKDIVALLKKPVSKLTAAQALSVAQWCEKSNDNPTSPNHVAMDVRTHVYCEAYLKVAKPKEADRQSVEATLKKVSQDMARAHVSEEQVRTMAAAYVEALAPPPAVAVAPVEAPAEKPEEKPAENPIEKPEKPERATPSKPLDTPEAKAPPARVAKIKVEPPPAPREAEPRREATSTIFDFGQD
jgi:hypothetical protein